MYPNDFVAYVSETYRRMDEAKEADHYRLVMECEECREKTNFSTYVSGLLAALTLFFIKRFS
jgi:hypothetical protein